MKQINGGKMSGALLIWARGNN